MVHAKCISGITQYTIHYDLAYRETSFQVSIDFVGVEFKEWWLNKQFQYTIKHQLNCCNELLCLFSGIIENMKVSIVNNFGCCCNNDKMLYT